MGKIFWGRENIQMAAAYWHFAKGSKVQTAIHQLKYRGQAQMGISIGQLYGNDLKRSIYYSTIDMIIPVPLHPLRTQERGYNQSEVFARGLSKSMQRPVNTSVLKRTLFTNTQTKKARYGRHENVARAFKIKSPKPAEGKHILLVDDVITTGATLEACVHQLLTIPNTKVSIATIAYASNYA